MDLLQFKEQYSNLLRDKISSELQVLKEYKLNGVEPFKYGTVQKRIDNTEEMIKKLDNLENIKFGNMDFWGYSNSSDKLLVSILTSNIKLYRESISFDTFAKIIENAKKYGFTKFIIKNDNLVDFYRVENETNVVFNIDNIDVNVSDININQKYQDSLPNASSYYKIQHTRNGASNSYWNIGGVRVYD